MVPFLEWLVYDFVSQEGLNLGSEYLERRGNALPGRDLLERLLQSHLGLYEVREAHPGEGLVLHDLLEDKTMQVAEKLGSESLVRWDVVAARVVEMDGTLRLTGGILLFSPEDRNDLMKLARHVCEEGRKWVPRADWSTLLKASAYIFDRFLEQKTRLLKAQGMPRLATSDGHEMVFAKAFYRLEDEAAARGALRVARDFEEDPASKEFVWLEPSEDEDGPRRILGQVTFQSGRMFLECHSRERLERGKALLGSLLGGIAVHQNDVLRDPWKAVEEEQPRSGRWPEERRPGVGKPREASLAEIPPGVKADILQKMYDGHYRKWVDEPIPALAGKTPREAARLKRSRAQVAALVRNLENREARAAQRSGFGYDASWVWRELGLDAEEGLHLGGRKKRPAGRKREGKPS